MLRLTSNFLWFALGILIAAAFMTPYAYSQVSYNGIPTEVVGPFSGYGPDANPYRHLDFRNIKPSTTGTSTGVDVTRTGTVSSPTKTGVNIRIPIGVKTSIDRAALARGIARAARVTPGGVAFGIAVDYGIQNGIFECQTYGWCKEEGGDILVQPGWSFQSNVRGTYPSAMSAAEASCLPKADSTYLTNLRVENLKTITFDPSTVNEDVDARASYDCVGNDGARVGVLDRGIVDHWKGSSTGDKKLVPSIPPYEDPGFLPWLQTGQGNTPNRGNPQLYDAGHNEGGDVENPQNEPQLPTKWDTPTRSEPPITQKKTSSNPDGTTSTETKTTTTTHKPNVGGDNTVNNTYINNVTTITNTTTTIRNDQTGVEETTNETTEEEGKEEDVAFSDSAMPDVPKLYEQKYPGGMAAAWRDHKPNLEGTQFWAGIKQMFPSFSSSGSCPAWAMSFDLGGAGNFGTIPINVPCWIFQAIGLIILTTAAFTARKIIF